MKAEDFKILNLIFLGIDKDNLESDSIFENYSDIPKQHKKKIFPFYTCLNSDNSIRWIWPQNNLDATFLNFYNVSNFKSTIIFYTYKIILKFNFKLLFKILRIRSLWVLCETLFFEEFVENLEYENYSLFLGTIGPNRKVVLEISNKEGKSIYFLKLPISEKSKELIRQELKHILEIKQKNYKTFEVPEVIQLKNDLFLQSNLAINNNRNLDVNKVIINYLHEITLKSKEVVLFHDFKQKIVVELNEISTTKKELESIKNNLLKFVQSLDIQYIYLSYSHGDFTPWNMYANSHKIFLYDWELAAKRPLLFDLFHFVMQRDIMINNIGFSGIKNNILILETTLLKDYLFENNINYKQYFYYYIITVSVYYLKVYSEQEILHQQAYWVLNIWDQFINEGLNENEIFK